MTATVQAAKFNVELQAPVNLTVFSFARLSLMSLVLFTMIFLRQEVLGAEAVIQVYAVLSASFFFSLIHVVYWTEVLKVRYFVPSQLLYDILLTSYLVYLTGVNESVFLFLYLFNIVFAATIYQLNGALLVALSSGTIYAALYYTNTNTENAGAWYNLAHNELLFLLAALLCGQLMSELKKQKIMLETQMQSISALELLNNQLLNSMPIGIMVVDHNDYVERINHTALHLLNIKHTPDFKVKYYELLPAIKGIKQKWEKLSENEKLRFYFKRRENDESNFSFQLVPLSESDSTSPRHMFIFEDVSKLLGLENKLAMESKLATIGQLSAGIAHEIRNPLASISGCIEVLSEQLEVQTVEDKKMITIALREIRRLNRLITDFLEFAKPKLNELAQFPVRKLVEETMDMVLSRKDKSATFHIEMKDEAVVLADREKMKQVFLNLFLNSIEAKKPEAVHITVRSWLENGEVVVEVQDDGNGIPRDISEKIFTPFFTTKSEGTGLGLASAAQILKSLNGDIRLCESETGARFQLRLPGSGTPESQILGAS